MEFNGFGKATMKIISNFEKLIGFTLPDDYKNFLLEYNGGKAQEKYSAFFVDELKQYIPFAVLYGLKKQLDLLCLNDEYWDDLIPNCIIIGHDPGSGMILLLNDPKIKGIFYWDH